MNFDTKYLESRVPTLLELGFNESQLGHLFHYMDLLWTSNDELNLFSRKMTATELVDNHLIDCLLPLKQFPSNIEYVADFGSGGGLPGVLYAINFPHIKFKLYEKSPMKQDFLKLCKKIAPNIEIHGEIPLELKKVDLVISRAFKPLDVILEMSRGYYLNGGKYFLLKGRLEKINEEIQLSKKKFKDLKLQIVSLKSPTMDVERHLIII